jgi:hypothetical protein
MSFQKGLLSLCTLGLGLYPASASILTFDSCGTSATSAILNSCSGGAINQNYGDRVTGANTDANGTEDRSYGESGEGFTPNIVTSYSTGFGWGSGFSALTNVIYAPGDVAFLNVTFTADPGFRARLLGFDLGAFFDLINFPNTTQYSGVNVSVFDENSTELFNQNYTVDINGVNQLINLQSGVGGFLTLSLNTSNLAWDPASGIFDRESIAFDNIRFAQTAATEPPPTGDIPEPSTFALVGGAALLAAWARNRR